VVLASSQRDRGLRPARLSRHTERAIGIAKPSA
jgi:hypothetical protein